MNLLGFILTIIVCYVILKVAYGYWLSAEIEDKKERITRLNKNYADVLEFKNRHGGDNKKKQKVIDDFKGED